MLHLQSKTGKICQVDVKDHLGILSSNLNSARKEGRLCDFLIKVGLRDFPVHKIIMSEGSDYFRGMFSHKMRENESGIADMKDIHPECMSICIEFIYTGKVSVPRSMILPLLNAAHLFQLNGLCGALIDFLDENLDSESYFTTKDLANKFGLTELEEKCDKFAKEHFESIVQEEGFKSVDKRTLLSLVCDKENMASDQVKLNAIFEWIRFEPKTRKKLLSKIHEYIDFSKVSVENRRKLIEDEQLVHSCNDLMRQISLSVLDSANIHSGCRHLAANEGPDDMTAEMIVSEFATPVSESAPISSDRSSAEVMPEANEGSLCPMSSEDFLAQMDAKEEPLIALDEFEPIVYPDGELFEEVDNGTYEYMQLVNGQELEKILNSNGTTIEVIAMDDTVKIKFVPDLTRSQCTPQAALEQFRRLYQQTSESTSRIVFDLEELTHSISNDQLVNAIGKIRNMYAKVYVAQLLSDLDQVLFIAATDQERDAAVTYFKRLLSRPLWGRTSGTMSLLMPVFKKTKLSK